MATRSHTLLLLLFMLLSRLARCDRRAVFRRPPKPKLHGPVVAAPTLPNGVPRLTLDLSHRTTPAAPVGAGTTGDVAVTAVSGGGTAAPPIGAGAVAAAVAGAPPSVPPAESKPGAAVPSTEGGAGAATDGDGSSGWSDAREEQAAGSSVRLAPSCKIVLRGKRSVPQRLRHGSLPAPLSVFTRGGDDGSARPVAADAKQWDAKVAAWAASRAQRAQQEVTRPPPAVVGDAGVSGGADRSETTTTTTTTAAALLPLGAWCAPTRGTRIRAAVAPPAGDALVRPQPWHRKRHVAPVTWRDAAVRAATMEAHATGLKVWAVHVPPLSQPRCSALALQSPAATQLAGTALRPAPIQAICSVRTLVAACPGVVVRHTALQLPAAEGRAAGAPDDGVNVVAVAVRSHAVSHVALPKLDRSKDAVAVLVRGMRWSFCCGCALSSRLRLFSVQDQRLASSAEAASLFSRHDFSYDVHARAYVSVPEVVRSTTNGVARVEIVLHLVALADARSCFVVNGVAI